jgi:hypothetical protein
MNAAMNAAIKAAAAWDDLARECDAWESQGRSVDLWWRDDDAIADTPELRRLLALAAGRAPLALAVIPDGLAPAAGPGLAAAIDRDGAGIAVLQHGFDHLNRAAAGAKKSEFPAERPAAEVAAALSAGRDRLRAAFGARFVPVLTPPWNRFDPRHLPALGSLGYRGITTYLARRNRVAAAGVIQVNTHVDVIDWHAGPIAPGEPGRRRFLGTGNALALLTGHLAAKRQGAADAGEATGLLTHHLVHDTETWDFLAALLAWCAVRPGVAWRGAAELFPEFGG